MVSLWPWKGEDNSPASFEKTLSALSTKITQASTRLDATRQQARRFTALWTLYSIFIYLLYTTIDVLVLGWKNWGVLEYAAVFGGPLVIYVVRSIGRSLFDYRIAKTQRLLDGLVKQRNETIERLKEATKYNSTQQLLEKYGGESPKPAPPSDPGEKHTGDTPARSPAAVQRTGIPPPPTANIRRRVPEPSTPNPGVPPVPDLRTPGASISPEQFQKPLPPPPPPGVEEPGFAPNAFPSIPQYHESPRWYDRLMDALLGEDETLPRNRLALICQQCRLVNGQAPPGVKSPEELGRWRCGGCRAWNGVESKPREPSPREFDQPAGETEEVSSGGDDADVSRATGKGRQAEPVTDSERTIS
ncbi:hypothetical protein VTN31DRAFT_683 [Thermomyces dupontii]|uniref:uncharacterized protein n=1 Tax=Talaromyces thermophilus TaxID=28565 RepID=UPI0037441E4C